MEKVFRRQLGADHVRIDTVEGYAGYWLLEPQVINVVDIRDAAEGAAYTLVEAEIDVRARIERAACGPCGEVRSFAVVPATGQRFELAGEIPAQAVQPLNLRVHAPFAGHGCAHLVSH